MKEFKTIFLLFIVNICLIADDFLVDPFRFLDTAIPPTVLEPIVEETEKSEKNILLEELVFLNTIRNRNVQNGEPFSDVVVIGSHQGQEVSDLINSAFNGLFSASDIIGIRKSIADTLEQTRQSFTDSAFFIDTNSGKLVAFTSAKDFTGEKRGEFGRSELVGNVIKVGDQNFRISAARNFSPIIIDISKNEKPGVSRGEWQPHAPKFFPERTALFDITGDGNQEFMEWLSPEDGLLVLPEIDGSVPSGHNLFGTAGGYEDGYAKMSILLDMDKNGWVEGDELLGLCIWQDKNSNAKAEEGEVKSVSEYNIERISTKHSYFESVCYMAGAYYKTWDWWPAGFSLEELK